MSKKVMVEMFQTCPKCNIQYLILYTDGSQECTYCGFQYNPTEKVKQE